MNIADGPVRGSPHSTAISGLPARPGVSGTNFASSNATTTISCERGFSTPTLAQPAQTSSAAKAVRTPVRTYARSLPPRLDELAVLLAIPDEMPETCVGQAAIGMRCVSRLE